MRISLELLDLPVSILTAAITEIRSEASIATIASTAESIR